MKTGTKLRVKFFGSRLSIQHKLLNILLLAGIFFGIISIGLTAIINPGNKMGLLSRSFIIFLLVIGFLLSNFLNKPTLASVLISFLTNSVLFPLNYFTNGGIQSGMAAWYLLGLFSTFLILKGWKCYLLFFLGVVSFAGTVFVSLIRPEIVIGFENDWQIGFDMLISIVLVSAIVGIIFKLQTYLYEVQQKKGYELNKKLQIAYKSKSEFLSNMSHDIRTPMNAIIGFTKIAQKDCGDKEKVKSCLEKISISSSYLLTLINNVLDMSKIESGVVSVDYSNFNLKRLIEDILQIVQIDMLEKHLMLVVDISDIEDVYVKSDKVKIRKIFMNIISNAIKYTPYGRHIYLYIKKINQRDENHITYEFRIKDEGEGISPEFLPHVFEPFEREKNSTVGGIVGTGLGLSIVKNSVELLGGTISVESELKHGTEFKFALEFEIVPQTEIESYEKDKILNFNNMRLLLVEDNSFNMEIGESVLKDMGFMVEKAFNGKEAFEMVKKSSHGYYDAVIMDVQMPILNGLEATKEIRKIEDVKLANIPIIAMTANAFDEDKRVALAVGMDDYISKPISYNEIAEVLYRVLKLRGERPSVNKV